jgi:hypothetical protein
MSPDDEGITHDFPIYLSDESRAHLRMVVGPRNRLLYFALMHQIQVAEEWVNVLRYDCSHGYVHVHRFKRGKAEPVAKRRVCDLDDIDRGYDEAVADVLGNWQENRRRYLNG